MFKSASPKPASDRRRFPRAGFGGLVAVQSGTVISTANVEEVSEGGVLLEAPWLAAEGSEVTVRLPLRGRFGRLDHCDLRGKVVRSRGQMVGVAFGKLLPRHKLQLRDYVWRAAQRP